MLEWLKTILGDSYTEDVDKQVSDAIGKHFVARSDYNAKNEAYKALEGQLSERDKQLEELKKADPEGLQKRIAELQNENKAAKESHDKQISELKFGYALDAALSGAKARNLTAVKALLHPEELKLSEDGKVIGLDAQLESLKTEAGYLFENDTPAPEFSGPTPGIPSGGKSPDKMTYTELAAYLEANPGVTI